MQISEFGLVGLCFLIGLVFVLVAYLLASLIRPNKPSAEKLTSYECGAASNNAVWLPFNSRFYVIGLVFLLFDVELAFLFPFTSVFADQTILAQVPAWGWLCLTEISIFIGVLLLGLAYIWQKGDLAWLKPQTKLPFVRSKVPPALYRVINEKKHLIRPFTSKRV